METLPFEISQEFENLGTYTLQPIKSGIIKPGTCIWVDHLMWFQLHKHTALLIYPCGSLYICTKDSCDNFLPNVKMQFIGFMSLLKLAKIEVAIGLKEASKFRQDTLLSESAKFDIYKQIERFYKIEKDARKCKK